MSRSRLFDALCLSLEQVAWRKRVLCNNERAKSTELDRVETLKPSGGNGEVAGIGDAVLGQCPNDRRADDNGDRR